MRDCLDNAIFEFDQDSLITEAKFDAKMSASRLLFAVLASMFSTLRFRGRSGRLDHQDELHSKKTASSLSFVVLVSMFSPLAFSMSIRPA